MKNPFIDLNIYSTLILLFSFICFAQPANDLPIPENSRQMILVLTDSITSTNGNLFYFEKQNDENVWTQINSKIPVVLGRNGLGWGRGLNSIDSSKLPIKTEGDGRSPAGVFELGAAFGYSTAEEIIGLKIPYMPITEIVECIDDIKSDYYNQIVKRDEIKKVDWQSSEKMFFFFFWYQQGVIVNQNTNPTSKGSGSCIFLHNWSQPNETSAGCTEMEPINLKRIIYWLDSSSNPILIQLTKQLFTEYKHIWKLPDPIDILP